MGRVEAGALVSAGLAQASMARLDTAMARLQDGVAVAEHSGELAQAAWARQALAFVKVLAVGRRALGELEAAVAACAGAERSIAVDAHAGLGRAHLLVGDPEGAENQFRLSLAATHRGDRLARAQALLGLGRAHVALGRYGEGDACLGQGVELARALGDSHAVAVGLAVAGESARLRGDTTSARHALSEAAAVARAGSAAYPLGLALIGLGRLGLDDGDDDGARERFAEALAIARAGPLAYLLADCVCGLAELSADTSVAESLLAEAVGAAQRWGDWWGEAAAFDQLGRRSRAAGDAVRATARHRHALGLRARIGDPAAIATSLEALAYLAAGEDAVVAARLLAAAESLRACHGCVRCRRLEADHALALASARHALGGGRFEAEWRQGAVLSTRAAVSYARAPRP